MQAALQSLPIRAVSMSANDGAPTLTMTSREIALLCDKQHQHVKRDIEKMLGELGEDASEFGRIYTDSMNRTQTEYALDRELTDTLLTGYSAVLRRRVIARWRELEEGAGPQVPKTLAQALRLAADQADVIEAQGKQITIMQPQVAALARLADTGRSMCQRDAAKHLQIKPMAFTRWLLEMGWTYRRTENSRIVAFQDRLDRGHLMHKLVEIDSSDGGKRQEPHVRVTPKGLARLSCLIEKGEGPK